MAAKNKPNEISIVRIYNAPVQLVWDAWTDPQQTAQWWGPRGFTLTTHSKDLRPGGVWHYTMHGPDGTDYINKTKYFEVEPLKKLVYDHGGNDEQAPLFRVTVTFAEKNKKTTMSMTMTLPTEEAARQTRKFVKQAGGNSTWDRLGEYVDKKTQGKDRFIINRTFNASVDVIYDMWTNPEHFSRWLPPVGFTMSFVRKDIREGGQSFFFMQGEDGTKFYGGLKYLALRKPDFISYVQDFRDEKENITRHPLMPVWPPAMLAVVELAEEDDGATRVTVTWEPHGATTAEEVSEFLKARGDMSQGWTGSFDKLDAILGIAEL